MKPAGFTFDGSVLLGAFGFAVAAAACVRAARIAHRHRGPSTASLWWGLTAVQLCFLLEVSMAWRYRLHAAVDAVLEARGTYMLRAPWQTALTLGVIVLAVASVVLVARRHRQNGALVGAFAGTALCVAVFLAETVSLHVVDRWMYAPVGSVVMLAWVWTLASTVVTVSALSAGRRLPRALR